MQQRERITKGNLSHLPLQIAFAFTDANKDEVIRPPPGEGSAFSFTNPEIRYLTMEKQLYLPMHKGKRKARAEQEKKNDNKKTCDSRRSPSDRESIEKWGISIKNREGTGEKHIDDNKGDPKSIDGK